MSWGAFRKIENHRQDVFVSFQYLAIVGDCLLGKVVDEVQCGYQILRARFIAAIKLSEQWHNLVRRKKTMVSSPVPWCADQHLFVEDNSAVKTPDYNYFA